MRGSDPDLRNEYVLITAHMDHVGVGRAVDGDSIYNGADDDGSGTVTVVEIARAFAGLENAPRRSIIFMTVSGEEKGLLGSRYYAENPTFPLENTVANINLDMVGRNWSDTIVAIGKDESTLGPQVERISVEHPELDMAVIDDIWPEESFYSRSDHYNFAQRGVPILFSRWHASDGWCSTSAWRSRTRKSVLPGTRKPTKEWSRHRARDAGKLNPPSAGNRLRV
jgi:Zn-dependent M28 family amino/carboxypeptidase